MKQISQLLVLVTFLIALDARAIDCGQRLENEFEYLRQIKMYEDLKVHAERIEHEEGWLAAREYLEDLDRRISAIRGSLEAMK